MELLQSELFKLLVGWALFLYLIAFVSLLLLLLFMFLVPRRLRGIERALWAINTQLDQIQHFMQSGEPGPTKAGEGQPPRRRVSLSMFGR